MPVFWPIVFTAAHLTLVADRVPQLNVRPSCRAAGLADSSEDSCLRDEKQARTKLEPDGSGFAASERERCTTLSHRGGSPSYVELLTCLEVAKQAKELPDTSGMKEKVGR
jgi:hypothetical protein